MVSVIWGAVYGLLFRRQTYGIGSAVGWGVAYGFFLWVVGPNTLFAVLTGNTPDWSAASAAPRMASMVGHLVYGAVLGRGLPLLRGPAQPVVAAAARTPRSARATPASPAPDIRAGDLGAGNADCPESADHLWRVRRDGTERDEIERAGRVDDGTVRTADGRHATDALRRREAGCRIPGSGISACRCFQPLSPPGSRVVRFVADRLVVRMVKPVTWDSHRCINRNTAIASRASPRR